jgi:hypothetical protein
MQFQAVVDRRADDATVNSKTATRPSKSATTSTIDRRGWAGFLVDHGGLWGILVWPRYNGSRLNAGEETSPVPREKPKPGKYCCKLDTLLG